MKLRAKLFLLVLGTMALMSLIAVVYFALSEGSNRLELEKGFLLTLTTALQAQTIAAAEVTSGKFSLPLEDLDHAKHEVDIAFAAIDQITAISALSPALRQSVEVVRNLKVLLDKRLKTFEERYAILYRDAQILFYFPKTKSVIDIFTFEFKPKERLYLEQAAAAHLRDYLIALEIVHESQSASRKIIKQQNLLIETAVEQSRISTVQNISLIVLAIVFSTLLVALVLASSIARAITKVQQGIAQLKAGDLTHRVESRTQDETGVLSRDLNMFADSLATSIKGIRSVSGHNVEMKNRLVDSANHALSASHVIEANTSSISGQINGLDRRIVSSVGAVGRIVQSISDFQSEIRAQSSMADQTTQAVSAMTVALGQMSAITARDRLAVAELVQVAGRGSVIFGQASALIADIPRSVGTIREMASIIDNLAAQTNLLAMNAAIEAAHAGQHGRGFAIVAAEIRKLAEASTKSSRDISESIDLIVDKIDSASLANTGTSRAFLAISEQIKVVTESMDQLFTAIAKIELENNRVLGAMQELRTSSDQAQTGASLIDAASSEIKVMMDELGRISSEVASEIGAITVGISGIGVAVRAVAELSDQVGTGSMQLDEEVRRFRVG